MVNPLSISYSISWSNNTYTITWNSTLNPQTIDNRVLILTKTGSDYLFNFGQSNVLTTLDSRKCTSPTASTHSALMTTITDLVTTEVDANTLNTNAISATGDLTISATDDIFMQAGDELSILATRNINVEGETTFTDEVNLDSSLRFMDVTSGNFATFQNPNGILTTHHYSPAIHSVYQLVAPSGNITSDFREATLSLVHTDDAGNSEFLDFYNDYYESTKQYGIRVQKRGTGEYRPFVIDFYDGTTKSEALTIDANQQVQIKSTTDSTSNTTGVLLVNGGIDVADGCNIWTYSLHATKFVYATTFYSNATTVYGNTSTQLLHVTDSSDSSDSSNGAAQISGGLGVIKDVYIGGVLHVDTIQTTGSSTAFNIPSLDGSSGDFLQINDSGSLSWTSPKKNYIHVSRFAANVTTTDVDFHPLNELYSNDFTEWFQFPDETITWEGFTLAQDDDTTVNLIYSIQTSKALAASPTSFTLQNTYDGTKNFPDPPTSNSVYLAILASKGITRRFAFDYTFTTSVNDLLKIQIKVDQEGSVQEEVLLSLWGYY
jgi:hypothetical protein